MQLKEYLYHKNKKLAPFARDINESYAKMYNVYRGQIPTLIVAKKIVDATDGEVSINDLLNLNKPK